MAKTTTAFEVSIEKPIEILISYLIPKAIDGNYKKH